MGIRVIGQIQHDTAADLANIEKVARSYGWSPRVRPVLPDGTLGPEQDNPTSAKQHLINEWREMCAARLRRILKQEAADAAGNNVSVG